MQIYTEQTIVEQIQQCQPLSLSWQYCKQYKLNTTITNYRDSIAKSCNKSWLVRLYTIQNQPFKWQLCLYAKKTYTRAYHMHINWLKNVTEIFTKVHETRYTQQSTTICGDITNNDKLQFELCLHVWHRQYYRIKIMHCQHNHKSQSKIPMKLGKNSEKKVFEETSLL